METATTDIYTLSLHDALPIFEEHVLEEVRHPGDLIRLVKVPGLDPGVDGDHAAARYLARDQREPVGQGAGADIGEERSEEHTSELQSQSNLVCRLLLEKKKSN